MYPTWKETWIFMIFLKLATVKAKVISRSIGGPFSKQERTMCLNPYRWSLSKRAPSVLEWTLTRAPMWKKKGGETPANTALPPTRYPTIQNFSYFKHLSETTIASIVIRWLQVHQTLWHEINLIDESAVIGILNSHDHLIHHSHWDINIKNSN